MLGLARGRVKLVPHRKQWKRLFELEKKHLQKQLGKTFVDIQHIGSTSIPGMIAKPILDISASVPSLKAAKKRLMKSMKRMGYEYISRPRHRHDLLFVKGPETKRTHHIHIVRHNGAVWKQTVSFRDYLRTHPNQAKQYASLKQKLAKKYAAKRSSYTSAKRAFVKRIVKQAKNSSHSRV